MLVAAPFITQELVPARTPEIGRYPVVSKLKTKRRTIETGKPQMSVATTFLTLDPVPASRHFIVFQTAEQN